MIYAPDKPVEDTYNGKNTRAIQIVPRSRIRLINKYRVWRSEHENKEQRASLEGELKHLEENKSLFSKSRYMIEQGSVERVQQKIDKVKEQLTILDINKNIINNQKYELSKEKPLRLIPSMFKIIKNTYYVAASKVMERKNERVAEVAMNVTDFSREDSVASDYEAVNKGSIFDSIDRPVYDKGSSTFYQEPNKDSILDSVSSGIERGRVRSLPSVIPAKFELSASDEPKNISFDDNVEDHLVVNDKFSFDKSMASLEASSSKDSQMSGNIDFSNGSISSLEEMKEELLKLQKLRDVQKEKAKQASEMREKAIQNKVEATKEKERMMQKYAEYASALQKEINESMKVEAEENRIAANAKQQAEQDLAETRAIEEMLTPVSDTSSLNMATTSKSL